MTKINPLYEAALIDILFDACEKDARSLLAAQTEIDIEAYSCDRILAVYNIDESDSAYELDPPADERDVVLAFVLGPVLAMKREHAANALPFGSALSRSMAVARHLGVVEERFKRLEHEKSIVSTARSENSRQAAQARHKEHREQADKIKAWFIEHHTQFKSMDSAAEYCCCNLDWVKLSWRAVRAHIGSAKKELKSTQSASKA